MTVITQGATSDLMLSLANEHTFFFPKWKGLHSLLVSKRCNFPSLDFWCSCNSKVGASIWGGGMGFALCSPCEQGQAEGVTVASWGCSKVPERPWCGWAPALLLCPSCRQRHSQEQWGAALGLYWTGNNLSNISGSWVSSACRGMPWGWDNAQSMGVSCSYE